MQEAKVLSGYVKYLNIKSLNPYSSKRFLITLISLWAFFLNPQTIFAEWPTFRNNNRHTAQANYLTSDLSLIHWTSNNISTIISPPITTLSGEIYIPTKSGIVKMDMSGKVLWTFGIGNPNSTPLIDSNDNLYFTTGDCNPIIYSITKQGVLRWKYELKPSSFGCGSNQATGPLTLTSDNSSLLIGVNTPSKTLLSLSLNGTKNWQVSLNDQYPSSSPSLDSEGNIYIGTGGNGQLISLNPAGGLRWSKIAGVGPTVNVSTPAIDKDNNIFVSGYATLSSFSNNGQKRWSYSIGDSAFSGEPALFDNFVTIAERNIIHTLDIGSGNLKWKWTAPTSPSNFLSSPVIDTNGVIYTTSRDFIYALTPEGELKYSLSLPSRIGPPTLYADGSLLIFQNKPGTNEGYLRSIGKPEPPKLLPVIFIPGIGGSELKTSQDIFWSENDGHGGIYSHAYKKDEKIWVNESEAINLGDDDYFDILRLKDDGETPQAPLTLTGTLTSQGYQDIDKFFSDLGYIKDVNFFNFPYDWRKDISLTENGLDNLIEKAKSKTGQNKVNIVAHSMGGLVARNYTISSEKANKVHKLITLGTPYLGSVEALKTLVYGKSIDVDFYFLNIPIVNHAAIKELFINYASVYSLSPNQQYFSMYNNIIPFFDYRDIDNNSETGPLDFNQTENILKFFNLNPLLIDKAKSFHQKPLLSQPPNIKTYLIAGTGQPTLGQIKETWWVNWPFKSIPRTEEVYINGDETVPLYSASLKSEFLDLSGNSKIYYVNQTHSDLVRGNGEAMLLVKSILNEGDILQSGNLIKKLEGKQITLTGDIAINLYDDSGNHTGLNSDSKFEENIPGTTYRSINNSKHIFIKSNASQLKVKIDSPIETKTTISIKEYKNDKIEKTYLYKDIPLSKNSPIESLISPTSPSAPTLTSTSITYTPTLEIPPTLLTDTSPPKTSIEITGNKNTDLEFQDQVTISLTAIDESGISSLEYSLDNLKNIKAYTNPIKLSTPGKYTLLFYSIDKAGNPETPKSYSFTIVSSSQNNNSTSSTSSNTQPTSSTNTSSLSSINETFTTLPISQSSPIGIQTTLTPTNIDPEQLNKILIENDLNPKGQLTKEVLGINTQSSKNKKSITFLTIIKLISIIAGSLTLLFTLSLIQNPPYKMDNKKPKQHIDNMYNPKRK